MPVPGLGPYDPSNIFARILRGELPANRIYEDEFRSDAHRATSAIYFRPRGRTDCFNRPRLTELIYVRCHFTKSVLLNGAITFS